MKRAILLCLLLGSTSVVYGQQAAAPAAKRLEFEVASINPLVIDHAEKVPTEN